MKSFVALDFKMWHKPSARLNMLERLNNAAAAVIRLCAASYKAVIAAIKPKITPGAFAAASG